MASQYVIDLGYNDDLTTVIKKVNHNFKAITGQQAKQAQIDAGDYTDLIASLVGQAVDDLVDMINHEAYLRSGADQDLENAIETVDDKFDDYTKTVDFATVATSGNYDDLVNAPEIPVNGAYLTFGNENPSTIHGNTWTQVGTISVGSESLKVWRRTN